jgi:hypothetical protein
MFKTYITCWANDLARDIEAAYDLAPNSINIRNLFFPGCENDSYKVLCFGEDMYEDYREEALHDATKPAVSRYLVCKYLREFFEPKGIDTILVDVTW